MSDVRALLLDIAGHERPAGGRGAAPDADAAPVSPDAPAVNPDAAADNADSAPVNFESWGSKSWARKLEKLGLEKLGKIVAELPLLHQEMLFFKLAGYTDATLELVLRVAPRVAQASFERLPPDFAAARRSPATAVHGQRNGWRRCTPRGRPRRTNARNCTNSCASRTGK